jgi:predicted anti-sigma-YlaC factor YlaD
VKSPLPNSALFRRVGGNIRPGVSDYRSVECEVAREALSARIDGEREPVPAARVDEHLDQCADCRVWRDHMSVQAENLRRMVHRPAALPPDTHTRATAPTRLRVSWQRWALAAVGVLQIVVGAAQALGVSLGLTHHDGIGFGGHLVNESTAWSITLGVVMVVAAVRPGAAAGLAGVLSVFVGMLTVYVVADAMSGAVTVTRVLTHVPVVLGAILAILCWRSSIRPRPDERAAEPDIVLPHQASRGRRRGHLWPTDGSAA